MDSNLYSGLARRRVQRDPRRPPILRLDSITHFTERRRRLVHRGTWSGAGTRQAAIQKAMEGSDINRRVLAGEEFQRITGMTLTKPPATEDEEIKKKNIQVVRQWWEQNREVVVWVSRVVIENYL